MKKLNLLTGLMLACLLLGSISTGCRSSDPVQMENGTFEVRAGDQIQFNGVANAHALSKAEMATYVSDWLYIRGLARRNESFAFNHADPRQHRFVMLRLKMAGKTPRNSPELFARVNQLRANHIAKGLQDGTVVNRIGTTEERQDRHYFTSVNVVGTQLESIATASVERSLYYSYLDTATWDNNGNLLGNVAYTEVYGNLPYGNAKTVGDLNLASTNLLAADTLVIIDGPAGYEEYYQVADNARGPDFEVRITAPVDRTDDSDDYIGICLDRTWTQDCDINVTGYSTLRIPLAGSVRIKNLFTFDTNAIENLKNQAGGDGGGRISVMLKTNGGGCNISGSAGLIPGMQAFWRTVTYSADKKTLYWNMTGNSIALFHQSCRLIQDSVELSMTVRLPYVQDNTNNRGNQFIFISNNPNEERADARIPRQIKITNSCLAAGTMIEMANGSSQPIERIHLGEQVSTLYHSTQTALTVSDVATGMERSPMVRIEDEQGRSLLMTEMHPIQVVGRGMVTAKSLRVGDRVMTKTGPSRLARVSRETYTGSVHNLKVGTLAETKNFGSDQTVFYANGFLVGDGQIQSKYEALEMSLAHAPPQRLPLRWRQDFLNSSRR